jgi:hypothetical protein
LAEGSDENCHDHRSGVARPGLFRFRIERVSGIHSCEAVAHGTSRTVRDGSDAVPLRLFVSGFQLIGGALLLIGLYIPLALAILGPVIVNILLYHLLLDHFGGSMAIVVALLWIFLFWRYRQYFSCLFVQKA